MRLDMNRLTKSIIAHIPNPLFTAKELAVLEPSSDNVRYALVKRAIADGDMLKIRRGLYALSPLYRKTGINPLSAAQLVYGPSYISLETALSVHGWIPEGVRDITSVALRPPKDFDTPIGHFSYVRVPQKTLYAGVTRGTGDEGQSWLIASPLKALADYVYCHKLDWTSKNPLIDSLRIEEDQLSEMTQADFDELEGNYSSRRVLRFLAGLKKEILP
jgi:hypothetical protein